MSEASREPARYRAEIDGLRAIAVLSVLIFHSELGFGGGGYLGVDIFFVISGFLITSLLLKDIGSGQFHILAFWERRVRRILPALVVVMAASLVAGWFLLMPNDFKELGQSALAQALLVANGYFSRQSGYFDQAATYKPLLHTWSLSVEEQFYLLFPWLLMATRRLPRRLLMAGILLAGGVSFVAGDFYPNHPALNFYMLPGRAWELLLGAFLAMMPVPRDSPRWLDELLTGVGLLAILRSVLVHDSAGPATGATALPPCLGAALIIWSNGRRLTTLGGGLAARPLVFIGLLSYSLYLWHWPVLVFHRYWAADPVPAILRVLLWLPTMALAYLSWKFVETPIRKRALLKARPRLFAAAAAATAGLVLAGLCISRWEGFPSRLPPEVVQYASGSTDRAFETNVTLAAAQSGAFVELGARDARLPVRLLVWGDSHAMAAMPALDDLCRSRGVRGVAATHAATAPLVGYVSSERFSAADCVAFNDAVIRFVAAHRVTDVLVIARWDVYLERDGGTDRLRRGVQETAVALQRAGARAWFMRQVPIQGCDVPHVLAQAAFHGHHPEALGLPLARHEDMRRIQGPVFDGVAAPGIMVLDPTEYLVGSNQVCRMQADGRSLYSDSTHLSVAGAMWLRPLFEPVVAAAAQDPAPR